VTRPPDLRDLIGDEDPNERLARAHELLTAAGAPPEGALPEPPSVARRRPQAFVRRRWAQLALAAALAGLALAVGLALGTRGGGFESVATLSMHGVPPVAAASAELEIGETEDGNVPMEMHVDGLPALPQGGWYELFLTKKGVIGLSCGTFNSAGDDTTVRLNVGYDLRTLRTEGRFDGWAITAHVPGQPASARRVLLTT
jgi:hypothetical protein